MDLIKLSIKNPVTILVGVIFILLVGFFSLTKLPYQLTPHVTQPKISITTVWPGATPYEIERDIIEEQEKTLKSTPKLTSYESSAKDNVGTITLKFKIGTDIKEAMLDVSNKLNEVQRYPENVEKPVIKSSGESASPVIWSMLMTKEGNNNDIDEYKTMFENEIKEHIERVEGVSSLFVAGGTGKEMHIVVDQERLAAYGITVDQLIDVVRRENVDISAGTIDVSRRSYRVRTTSQFRNAQSIKDVVIVSDGQKRVTLGDVADVVIGYHKKEQTVMFLGKQGIAMGVVPEPTANVVDVTNRVEVAVKELNEGILAKHNLYIRWLYDQRPYIGGAIDLVQQNIFVGAILAIIVLILFLRSFSATSVVAMAIPISIVATFSIFQLMGRSLNTISLAGISFTVGMLLDSAIVVLENIDRHRKMGKTFYLAAYDGTSEVWGALIASALTTIAVFVPIVFLEDEAGQLFKDIAIAVTAAISFSLFVSISVIPMLWTQIMRFTKSHEKKTKADDFRERTQFIVEFGQKANAAIMNLLQMALKNRMTQIQTVAILTAFSLLSVWILFPKMEYLPQGNQNLVMSILIPPPGLSYEEKREMGIKLFKRYMPYVNKEKDGFPAINRMFYVSIGGFVLMGATSLHEQRAAELIPLFVPGVNSFPGVFGISVQRGVFEEGIGEGRSIDVDLSGADIEKIANVGGMLFGTIMQGMKGSQVRPVPSVELLFPEVRLTPNRDRLKAVGLDSTSLGTFADIMLDGRKIGEFKQAGQKKIDLVMTGDTNEINTPEKLYKSLIATPGGKLVPIEELAQVERTTGISEIRHLGGKRTITLRVTPPLNMTVEEAMGVLQEGIIAGVKKQGMLKGIDVSLTGTADKLLSTVGTMKWNLVFALIITFLLMATLFSNFIYPLVILFTIPLATAGGFIGLAITNLLIAPQPLDILTMLGFVILIGIVVNNAILIVHQSLNYIRNDGMEYKEGILEATRTRLRPIFMSSITSIFGMLPLILAPGPGSEFYRGLGSVITGGLAFSTVFTIFVTPALLLFVIKFEELRTKGETVAMEE
ncbi:MAG: efflux RND transporter permease subunit [Nitrospinae bacterium]|nr:efflux RND transporter permease subunit [Nitrospinota bacterium]